MSTIDSYQKKIETKFECLIKLSEATGDNNTLTDIRKLQMKYHEGVSSVLLNYYEIMSTDATQDDYRKTVSELHDTYKRFMISENILGRMNYIFDNISPNVCKTNVVDIWSREEFENKFDDDLIDWVDEFVKNINDGTRAEEPLDVNKLKRTYQDQKVSFSIDRERIDICDECGGHMTVFPNRSELQCDEPKCQKIVTLYGIVFEDSQFYNQQNTCTKSKKYDPNSHCAKWIDKIQAREDWNFPEHVISKIDAVAISEYTRSNRLRPMINLRCETVRNWLKRFKFVDQYDHAPLLRRRITAMHGQPVVPPQLTARERQRILIEYELCMRDFEEVIREPEVLRRLDKSCVRNKFYYPYILWKLINLLLLKDPRRKGLLECIHLQSDNTLMRNDIVWEQICKRRNYLYMATNSNFVY